MLVSFLGACGLVDIYLLMSSESSLAYRCQAANQDPQWGRGVWKTCTMTVV